MLQKFSNKWAALTAALMFALVTPAAFASGGGGGVDVSATVSAIGDALGPIGQIGIAVLGVLVAIKVYKWVRRAM
ncbi:major capsid protein [Luteimonas sp. SDU82]|uniref:major capsid protein n=1 Tax=Luteimonas sp. SDU82 TaxID=3422592 RepID=UPI003EBE5FF1